MYKKVLVTGGAGFIGTNLINKLVSENIQVYSLDNYSTGIKDNESVLATYINGDIESIENISETNFDVCFHLAAQSLVKKSYSNSTYTWETNAIGTLNVLES